MSADEFIAVLPPGHPLAARRALEWAQVAREPVIGYLPGNPVRRLLEEKLAERGIVLDYAFEIALPWTMMGLAREGLGIAIVTMALRPLAQWHGLEVRAVGRPQFARTMTLLRAPGNALSPAAAAFRDVLLGARVPPARRRAEAHARKRAVVLQASRSASVRAITLVARRRSSSSSRSSARLACDSSTVRGPAP